MKLYKNLAKLFVLFFVIFIFSSFKNNKDNIYVGEVSLFFNEPFTQLGIITDNNEILFIDKNFKDYDKLQQYQGIRVIINGYVILNELDDKVLIVESFELAPRPKISE